MDLTGTVNRYAAPKISEYDVASRIAGSLTGSMEQLFQRFEINYFVQWGMQFFGFLTDDSSYV